MSQKTDLLKLFRANGNKLTLGQILKTNLAAEYRARISELRRDGYVIPPCEEKPTPSDNVYTLIEEPEAKNAAKISQYRKIQSQYPEGHPQKDAIETQINCLLLKNK